MTRSLLMLWRFTWHSADISPYYAKCNYASLRALTYKVITFVHKETLSVFACVLFEAVKHGKDYL